MASRAEAQSRARGASRGGKVWAVPCGAHCGVAWGPSGYAQCETAPNLELALPCSYTGGRCCTLLMFSAGTATGRLNPPRDIEISARAAARILPARPKSRSAQLWSIALLALLSSCSLQFSAGQRSHFRCSLRHCTGALPGKGTVRKRNEWCRDGIQLPLWRQHGKRERGGGQLM